MKWDQRLADRLYAKAYEDANGCWVWTASSQNGGYGRIGLGTREQGVALAYRVSYQLMVGDIPEGLVLDHLCRNRTCINPYHLEPVTQSENLRRGDNARVARERCAKITHCAQGHEFTPENTGIHIEGYRFCRICSRNAQRAYRAKKAGSGGVPD